MKNLSGIFKSVVFSVVLLVGSQTPSAEEIPLLDFDARVYPEVATHGMVASQEARATQIGVDILAEGGNAVDAAVAVGFALAVTLPRAGNIGGGGFMMIYEQKSQKIEALDYRETAPALASQNMFVDEQGEVDNNKARHSLQSAGVPGTVAGLVEAHKKYGSMPLKKLLQPAIALAKNLPMSFAMSQSLNAKRDYLSKNPASQAIFVRSDSKPWAIGDTLKQAELAAVLERIAETDGMDFYQGKTAQIFSDYMQAHGGLIRAADLADYQPVWRKPIMARLGDYQVYSMPPPSSGGVHLIQLLNILKQFPIKSWGENTSLTTHVKAEAMKYAYADRSEYLGDPEFVEVPVSLLVDEDYAKTIAGKIDLKKSTQSTQIKPGMHLDQESPQTTHYSIMDQQGNVVSNTYTLNFSFGSGITVPGLGMLLNNEMDDFSAKPGTPNGFGLLGGDANAIAARKRPLSSMTPVIVLNNGQPWLATGSPGGSRIITSVLNFLLNRIVHGMNIAEATQSPRVHHQWYPDVLMVESGFPRDTAEQLKNLGHQLEYRNVWSSVQSVEFSDGIYYGFSDSRRPGALAKGLFAPKQP